MATVNLKVGSVKGAKSLFDIPSAQKIVEATLRNQRTRRFQTSGSSDGPGMAWEPLRHRAGKPLKDKGILEKSVSMVSRTTERGFFVEFGSSQANALVANVHQFGIKNDIVPRKKKALFIPVTNKAKRSSLVEGRRVGQTSSRRGREARPSELTQGRDFILRTAVRATAEKGGFAVQPRPHFRITQTNVKEIVDNLTAAVIRGR